MITHLTCGSFDLGNESSINGSSYSNYGSSSTGLYGLNLNITDFSSSSFPNYVSAYTGSSSPIYGPQVHLIRSAWVTIKIQSLSISVWYCT